MDLTVFNIIKIFFAGAITFISPCFLPLVPAYLSYVSGLSLSRFTGREKEAADVWFVTLNAVLFVAGFTVVFTSLGMSANVLGNYFAVNQMIMSRIAGVLFILFGLMYITGRTFIFSSFWSSGILSGGYYTYFRYLTPFIVGCAFSISWTPCLTPVLAAILNIASVQNTAYEGGLQLFVFSIGLGVPFVLSAVFADKLLSILKNGKYFIRYLRVFVGIVLIITGILIASNNLIFLDRLFDVF